MPKKSPSPVAVLTVHGVPTMSAPYRKMIAGWLRRQATLLQSASAPKKLSKRYTARHY